MNRVKTSANRIRLAQRDIRVFRNGRFSHQYHRNKLIAFAAHILDRYSDRKQRWPLMNMVLPHTARPAWPQPFQQYHAWQMRTQIALTLIKQFPTVSLHTPTAVLSAQPAAPQPFTAGESPSLLPVRKVRTNVQRLNFETLRRKEMVYHQNQLDTQRLAEKLIVRHQELLVQRLEQRVQRIEHIQPEQPAKTQAARALPESTTVRPLALPIPRIVWRQKGVLPDSRPPANGQVLRSSREYHLENGRSPTKNSADEAAMPQININNLADQVIRNIDQRVIAYRERMGKI